MNSQGSTPDSLIDRISIGTLLLGAILLGLAPFYPEPHLLEKVRMLLQGTLSQAMDIFDLVFHAFPLPLLLWKILRLRSLKSRAESGN